MVALTLLVAASGMCLGQETAAVVVGKLLSKYADAKTLSGTVRFTQSLGNVSVGIDTRIQFERPSKLFIRQDRRSSEPKTWIVTSDGKIFSYDPPDNLSGGTSRLLEAIPESGSIKDIYNATSRSMGDRDAPLIIAISRQRDLEYLRNQWVSVDYVEPKPANSEGYVVVGGKWREFVSAPASGSWELWLDAKGELRKYVRREVIAAEGMAPQQVVTVWDVAFEIDGKVDPTLFQVIR